MKIEEMSLIMWTRVVTSIVKETNGAVASAEAAFAVAPDVDDDDNAECGWP